ncbi:hypothetical protein XENOCAPTIV_016565 [Xenoophorus captivus]|uniref:Uncharacterized protein n=1 Tax=Xenoophorus captivus TaxID=1517983 RepID=A0ABV0Q498_9TELE
MRPYSPILICEQPQVLSELLYLSHVCPNKNCRELLNLAAFDCFKHIKTVQRLPPCWIHRRHQAESLKDLPYRHIPQDQILISDRAPLGESFYAQAPAGAQRDRGDTRSSCCAMENSSAQAAAIADFISYTLRQTVDSRGQRVIDGFSVTGRAMFLEGSELRTDAGLGFMTAPHTEPPHLVPAFWDSPLSHSINVFVGLVLCFTMLGLGCTVEVSQLGEHIRRPIGVLLALVCQFVIMPLVAFLLALAFSLDDVAAMAVLLCGCCPGGNLSNIMSLLVHGEMNLR